MWRYLLICSDNYNNSYRKVLNGCSIQGILEENDFSEEEPGKWIASYSKIDLNKLEYPSIIEPIEKFSKISNDDDFKIVVKELDENEHPIVLSVHYDNFLSIHFSEIFFVNDYEKNFFANYVEKDIDYSYLVVLTNFLVLSGFSSSRIFDRIIKFIENIKVVEFSPEKLRVSIKILT